eukprot:13330718-Alexandrium_andersonii.AAC.1
MVSPALGGALAALSGAPTHRSLHLGPARCAAAGARCPAPRARRRPADAQLAGAAVQRPGSAA